MTNSKLAKFIWRFLKITKALLSRLLFAVLSLICVWRVWEALNNSLYWLLLLLLLPLCVETIYSLCCTEQKKQLKWITPNVIFYLLCPVPCIWLLELRLLNDRLGSENNLESIFNTEKFFKNESRFIDINALINIDATDAEWTLALEQFLIFALVLAKWIAPKNGVTNQQLSQLLLVNIAAGADILELMETFNEDKVRTNREIVYLIMSVWTWSLLQFAVVLTTTKELPSLEEEVSLQRITVVANSNSNANQSAVIEPNLKKYERENPDKSALINLEKYSNQPDKSTRSSKREHPLNSSTEITNDQKYHELVEEKNSAAGNDNKKEKTSNQENSAGAVAITKSEQISVEDQTTKKSSQKSNNDNEETKYNNNRQHANTNGEKSASENAFGTNIDESPVTHSGPGCFCFYNEIWAIILSIVFQDGPFFVVRMVILTYYHVITHMNLFFTAKNIFVIFLLVNRIRVIVKTERRPWLEHMKMVKTQEKKREERKRIKELQRSVISRFRPSRSAWRSVVR